MRYKNFNMQMTHHHMFKNCEYLHFIFLKLEIRFTNLSFLYHSVKHGKEILKYVKKNLYSNFSAINLYKTKYKYNSKYGLHI